MPQLKVIVVGGGIGGLCLAQGLRAAGVAVDVFERDTAPGSRWEGYRIHIDPAGARSLHACLPASHWATFLSTSGRGGDLGFLTEQLAELVVVEESLMYPGRGDDPAEDHYAVDRAVLRRILLAGLEDRVRFGAEFVRYEPAPDGRVAAVFADGHRAIGDVLVGADGAASRVARQYLPQARRVESGVGGIGYKVRLTDQTRRWLPQRLQRGMNVVSGSGPVSLFTSVFQPPPEAAAALGQLTPAAAGIDPAPYLLCALVTRAAALPADLAAYDGAALVQLAQRFITGWHPALRRMLVESDPAARTGITFQYSTRTPAWSPSRVTVLGDAIHTMPATGGRGGNTALRDARLLTDLLTAADRGQCPLLDAIGQYERLMREHGYAAIDEALATRDRMTTTGTLATLGARTWFRLCRALPALRRRTFTTWSDSIRPQAWERATNAHGTATTAGPYPSH
jgi:2-polyprenyl-6-methoxyphenol hydroxylase-like FAD-dependent oxidoreductase